MQVQKITVAGSPRPIGDPSIRIRLILEQFPYDHDRIQSWHKMGFERYYIAYVGAHPGETICPNDFDGMTALLVAVLSFKIIERAAA